MIRYIPQSQLTLEGFDTPFSQHLDKDNRWVKLAATIPWDKLANIYYRKMDTDFGAPSLSARMVIGAVIIKHMLNIDDREVVCTDTGKYVPAIFCWTKQLYYHRTL